MNTAIRQERDMLNEILKEGIHHLHARGMTSAEIGRVIGYPSGAMVYEVLNKPGPLFGPLQLWRFSRLCSRHGYDAIADAFSTEGKRTLPIPLDLITDGDIREEVMACVEHLGEVVRLDAQGRCHEAESAARRLVTAAQALRLEEELKHLGGDGHCAQDVSYHELLHDLP